MTLGKLKLAVYLLLASICLILGILSLTVFKANADAHDILLNLSTEIGGTVILFFILERLFEITSPAQTESNLSESGLKGCYERCPLMEMLDDIAKSSKEVLILQTWISNDRQIQDSLTEALRRGAKVKILLLNPDSDFAVFRSRESNLGSNNEVSNRIRVALASFHRFKQLDPLHTSKIDLRHYTGTPTFALFATDENVYFMPYFRGTTSYQSPCLKVSHKTDKYFLRMLTEHFWHIWQQASEYRSNGTNE